MIFSFEKIIDELIPTLFPIKILPLSAMNLHSDDAMPGPKLPELHTKLFPIEIFPLLVL